MSLLIQLIMLLIFPVLTSAQKGRYLESRLRMVNTQLASRGINDLKVLDAMRRVERHLFVPETIREEAYGDFPLPIGYGQTISQPYIVAYMTAAVNPTNTKKALEVGTGSGYQAAVLAEIVKEVYTIEIIPELAAASARLLKDLGYGNIHCRYGDGYQGWKEQAPFDIIIVTAAAEFVPEPLVEQLADNGRLIIPLGKSDTVQELTLLIKRKGRIERRVLAPVRFVPFRRL